MIKLHKCKDWRFLLSEPLTAQGGRNCGKTGGRGGQEKNEPYILANSPCQVTNSLFKLVWDLKTLKFGNKFRIKISDFKNVNLTWTSTYLLDTQVYTRVRLQTLWIYLILLFLGKFAIKLLKFLLNHDDLLSYILVYWSFSIAAVKRQACYI